MRSGNPPKILGISPETVARECQAIARRHAEHYGRQRGLHVLGQAIGEGDRRARAFLDGEARRIEAHEYLLAKQADLELRRALLDHYAARMRQINAELEGINDESSSVGGGEAVDMARVVA